jgi:hypothetical protein
MFKRILTLSLQYVAIVIGAFMLYPQLTFTQYCGLFIIFAVGTHVVLTVVKDIILMRDFMKTVKDAEQFTKAADEVFNVVQKMMREKSLAKTDTVDKTRH